MVVAPRVAVADRCARRRGRGRGALSALGTWAGLEKQCGAESGWLVMPDRALPGGRGRGKCRGSAAGEVGGCGGPGRHCWCRSAEDQLRGS